MKTALIVGAGMAGLTAAGVLQSRGWTVVLLDKGRGVGGRMATRRIGESRLDHGAQFFTVRDARFGEAVARWEAAGWVSPWFTENGHVRYRAAGGMNALAKQLAKPFDVRTDAKVESIARVDGGWQAATGNGERFRADALLLTAPAAQSAALLGEGPLVDVLKGIAFDPCFALLVTLDGTSGVPAPGFVRPEGGPVEWIADNTQKGVSGGAAALTIHARAEFTREYLDVPKEEVALLLLEAAGPWLGGEVNTWQVHRWLYSKPVAEGLPLFLSAEGLAVAGDAFGGGRVEGAFRSGLAAGEWLVSGHSPGR